MYDLTVNMSVRIFSLLNDESILAHIVSSLWWCADTFRDPGNSCHGDSQLGAESNRDYELREDKLISTNTNITYDKIIIWTKLSKCDLGLKEKWINLNLLLTLNYISGVFIVSSTFPPATINITWKIRLILYR